MRIWIFSDLHLEYADLRQPLAIPDADVCVVAGDLCRAPANGVHWLAEHIARAMPCVYVAGNHEFYKGSIKEAFEDGRAAAARFPDVHFLENDTVTLGGVQFVGATLWTDYFIEGHRELAMFHARERMNDYKQIAAQRNPWKRFLPQTAYRMHRDSRHFIEAAVKCDPDPIVVVTHHLPHPRSIPERFKGDLLNAAYASDLSDLIEKGKPLLWVHGHTHDSSDYRVGSTRILCNPRGYDDENKAFDPTLIVEM
jgi:Icc-related predicted phosphoesterase